MALKSGIVVTVKGELFIEADLADLEPDGSFAKAQKQVQDIKTKVEKVVPGVQVKAVAATRRDAASDQEPAAGK